MKKLLLVLAIGMVSTAFTSCNKCSTCTFDDPVQGQLVSEDVCQKGRQYQDVLEMYDRNGWECTEN